MAVSTRTSIVCIILHAARCVVLWHKEKTKRLVFIHFAKFCYFITYAFQLSALILSKNDMERFFECFSVISFCGMGILKLFSLHRNKEHWVGLLEKIKHLELGQLKRDENYYAAEYQSDREEDNCHVIGIGDYIMKLKRAAAILFRLYCFTGVIFIVSPFIEYGYEVFRGKATEGYPHILPSWNPFDAVHFSCYIAIVICEAVAAIYCVCVHIAFDTAVIGVVIFVCGQFSLLVHQSEKIGGRGKICNLSRKRDARAHLRIIKCHRVHVKLVSYINDLDGLLKNILGFYFFLATLTLCTVAVRLTSEKMGVMELVSLLQYLAATLTQLYIYCSYGDAVYNQTAIKAGTGPFAAAIWCLSPKIRREIAILGFGMMRPRRLHAGPFNTVDLPTFIQIVRAAYSYYAVLSSSKQKIK